MTLWVADLVVRATLLLALAALLAAWLRRAPAASRHLVWLAALTGVLVLPVSSLLVPKVAVPVPTGLVSAPVAAEPSAAGLPRLTAPADALMASDVGQGLAMAATRSVGSPAPREYSLHVDVPAVADMAGAPVPSRPSLARMLSGLWLLGVLVLLGRLFGGVLLTRRLARSAMAVDDEVARTTLADVTTDLGIRRPIRLRV